MDHDEKHTHEAPVIHHENEHKHHENDHKYHGSNNKNTSRYGYGPQNTRSKVSSVIVILLVLILITALVLWLLYRPHKPRFTVVGATLNATDTMQLTLVTRNPNNRVSIHYDHLVVFLSYNNQAISPPLRLPPLHHEKDSTVVMSPLLPIPPEFVNGLGNDEGYSGVSLRVVLTGRLRWKGGGIKSGHKRVFVGCDVLFGLKKGSLGQVPLLGPSVCKVDI